MMMSVEVLRLRSRGHPAIRGTHTKTLEFAADLDITARATCVVGVATTVAGPAYPPLAGPVRIVISCGGHAATVHATGNSLWQGGSSAVIRRSAERLPDTLATHADLAASDLPRELVYAMADPTAEIDALIKRDVRTIGTLVLYRAGPGSDRRLAVECAAADAVLAEDSAARQLIVEHGGAPSTAEEALSALARGRRLLAVSTVDRRSTTVQQVLAGMERPVVEVLGLPPELAVAAVSPQRASVLLARGLRRRELVRLAAAHPDMAVVFASPAERLPEVLAGAGRSAGRRTAAVIPAAPSRAERPWWGVAADFRPDARDDLLCCLDPLVAPVGGASDIDALGLVTSLLAQSVPPKTIARALAGQPGWSRQRAYDFVVGLAGRRKD